MEFIFLAIMFVMSVAIIVLYDRYADLRWRLDMSSRDAVRWKEEAVKRGWKHPFDEICDSLRQSAEKVAAVAEVMKRTNETQKASSASLREIDLKMRQANASMTVANADLAKAGEHLSRFGPQRLPPPPARLTLTPPTPQTRAAKEAFRKLEKEVVASFISEPDPRKRN